MNVTVNPGMLQGTVRQVMTSKSQAHRLLICAGQAEEETRLSAVPPCEDVEATLRCLRAMGTEIRTAGGKVVLRRQRATGTEIRTGGGEIALRRGDGTEGPAEMDCGESGSTLRFMLPTVATRGIQAAFTGRGKLAERPLSPLYEEMLRHGVKMSPQGRFPLTVSGRMEGGTYRLAGNVSSQFISGLMMALPQAEGDSRIIIEGRLESRPYVTLTAETLRVFGIRTAAAGTEIRVPGGQRFRSPGSVTVEGDWSGAAFWLAAGAISETGVTCGPLNPQSAQGDRAIVTLLRQFGAEVRENGNTVTVRRGAMRGTEIDAADIPDLVPILAVVAAYADGRTTIRNIRRLRMKESDRVASVLALIRSLGGDGEATENEIIIHGTDGLSGGTADAFRDHRIAMAAAIAATGAGKPVTILGAEAVNKSYPGFFEEFRALGGRIQA